jgi:hypothetical protein
MGQASSPPSVELIWRGIAVRLPAAWEMLQFSTDYSRGRCAFADRYQYRFELSWSIVKGEPDYDRMVTDYMGKLEREKAGSGLVRLRHAGWHGFTGTVSGTPTTRLGRYLPALGCLVEGVFLWSDGRDEALERQVTASIDAVPPDARGHQRWRAAGLDLSVPGVAALEGCTLQPAKAAFSFSNPKTGTSWQFERLGMVPSWFDGDLPAWLTRHLGPDLRDLRLTTTTRNNHAVVHADASFKPRALHLRRGHLTATAWIEPADGRLYAATLRRRGQDAAEAAAPGDLLTAAPDFTPRWSP